MSFIVLASVRLGSVGRTCRYVPTSQSLSSYPRCFLASCPSAIRRSVSLLSVDCPRMLSVMQDVGTYRQVRPLFVQLQIPNKSTTSRILPAFFSPRFAASSYMETAVHIISIRTFRKPPFIVSTSARLENIGRTCRYVPTSQSLSSYPRSFLVSCPSAVRRSVSLLSVDCPRMLSAVLDVGTYREVRPLFVQLQMPNKSTIAGYSRLSSLHVLRHLPI